jgi:histidyl-tRNA synthetase
VDVLGVKSMAAEAELLALAQDAFRELGLGGVTIHVNNRKLLEGILDYARVPETARIITVRTLDKMDKIGCEGVCEQLNNLTLTERKLSDTTCSTTYRHLASGKDIGLLKGDIIPEIGLEGYEELSRDVQSIPAEELMEFISGFTYRGKPQLSPEQVNIILSTCKAKDTNSDTLRGLEKVVSSAKGLEGLQEISLLLRYAETMGLDFARLEPSLARGLDYYTGTTLEVFLNDRSILSSAILAGGRYDDMVGDFKGGNEDIPAVGFSFGLERLAYILSARGATKQDMRDIYLIPLGVGTDHVLRVATQLRSQGLNVDIEFRPDTKVGKAIGYASDHDIPFVGIIGEDEMKQGGIAVKDLRRREQKTMPVEEVGTYLRTPLS